MITALITMYSCSNDNILPNKGVSEEQRISQRTPDCNVDVSEQVKVKVSERDDIPLTEILSSTYISTTTEGYCLYQVETRYDGTKWYHVTGIIGDEVEGW